MVKVQCLSIELGTRFDTLEHMVGETFVILYVHPLIFLRFFSFIIKVFINFHENENEIFFLDGRTYQIERLGI